MIRRLIALLQRLDTALEANRARAELRAMRPEQLEDLGISFAEIDDFIAGRLEPRFAPAAPKRLRLAASNDCCAPGCCLAA